MIYKLIWLNLLLVAITAGYTATAYVLYTVAGVILVLYAGITYTIGDDIRSTKKKNKPVPDEYNVLVPTNYKITKANIVCSSIIHLLLVFTQLGSIYLSIVILIGTILRLLSLNYLQMSTKKWQK